MKVFAPETPIFKDLRDYGIEIPLLASRPNAILQYLKANCPFPSPRNFISWAPAQELSQRDLARVHTPQYAASILSQDPFKPIAATYELVDKNGSYFRYNPALSTKPLSDLVQRTLVEASGTYRACEQALLDSEVYYLGGGMHHAMSQGGRGFCLINDIAIAIRKLQEENKASRFWVIDVDAHKGDGTAELFFAITRY